MARELEPDDALDVGEPHRHSAAIRGLWRAAQTRRLPHALLFHGPEGVGKFRSARWLAQGLLCERRERAAEDGPCGTCGPCKRVLGASHPDLYVVDVRDEVPEKRSEELRIGRFVPRDEPYWSDATVEDFLGLRAAEGGWRIVIVREMERANLEAQNSILKALEEPAAQVLWVLECSAMSALLPTIKSRCIQIAFERLNDDDVRACLLERGVAAELAGALARVAHGSPGLALRLRAQHALEMRELLLEALAGSTPTATISAALWELDGVFEGKTAKAQERARLRAALDLALALARDVTRMRAGVEVAELEHADVLARAADAQRFASDAALESVLGTLLELRRDVEANVDPPALLDRALLALAPQAQARARART